MPGFKLYEKEAQLCKRMEDGKTEYEMSVHHVNSLQEDMLGRQLPKVLLVLQYTLHQCANDVRICRWLRCSEVLLKIWLL